MYRNPPPVESRGLGTGLLAGFFGWFIALGLIVGISVLAVNNGVRGLAHVPPQAVFIVVLGICPWLARPTSWGVPVLYGLLSIPGYLVTLLLTSVTTATLVSHRSPMALLADGVFLGAFTRGYVSDTGTIVAHAYTVVLVLLSALIAVAVFRSRAKRRLAPAGPPPGYRPPPGPPPGPYGPPAHAGPAYPAAPPPPAYLSGPPAGYAAQYGPGHGAPPGPAPNPPAYPPVSGPPPAPAGYGPPPEPPRQPAAPVPAPPPVAGPPPVPGPPPAPAGGQPPPGTRRLDPDEFDQLIYEEEQERRAREEG